MGRGGWRRQGPKGGCIYEVRLYGLRQKQAGAGHSVQSSDRRPPSAEGKKSSKVPSCPASLGASRLVLYARTRPWLCVV